MTAQLHGAAIRFDSEDECFQIALPARLSTITGRQGRLRCRLDAVRRPDQSVAMSCADPFESEFDADRRLVLPRDLANRRGLSIDARVDITIEARICVRRWLFWRRMRVEPIRPDDAVTIDMTDEAAVAQTGPQSSAQSPPAAPDAPTTQRASLNGLRRRAASEMAAIQAAIEGSARGRKGSRRTGTASQDPAAASSGQTQPSVAPEIVLPATAGPAERRRLLEMQALYRTVRDSRLATAPGATWPVDIGLGELRPADHAPRTARSATR